MSAGIDEFDNALRTALSKRVNTKAVRRDSMAQISQPESKE
jgi:hypothetical protein